MNAMSEGQLAQNPLVEVIREIVEKELSGALRLSRDRAKAVIYFENGTLAFAASNLKSHRLSEFLNRQKILDDRQLAELPAKTTDKELTDSIVAQGRIKVEAVNAIRANHVSEILRSALLWTDGRWQFDPRVRIADESRVIVNVNRLLLECSRHLPPAYIASRFTDTNERLEPAKNNGLSTNLLPTEAFVLSRVSEKTSLAEVLSVSGLAEEEALRVIYGLSMSGFLRRSNLPSAISAKASSTAGDKTSSEAKSDGPENEQAELQALFTRVEKATDYYDVLSVGRQATAEELKSAYHTLARRYHPDRFHQRDATLRSQVDSAFAHIARAYETLGDQDLRAAYDAEQLAKSGASIPTNSAGSPAPRTLPNDRAEASFQQGLAALKQNQPEQAIRSFGEAANLEPRCARYRAEYGRALITNPQTRRIAEIELQAAIALEPTNAQYRVMLAELYKALGLRRRAEAELHRALGADPKNAAARTLLSSFKN